MGLSCSINHRGSQLCILRGGESQGTSRSPPALLLPVLGHTALFPLPPYPWGSDLFHGTDSPLIMNLQLILGWSLVMGVHPGSASHSRSLAVPPALLFFS